MFVCLLVQGKHTLNIKATMVKGTAEVNGVPSLQPPADQVYTSKVTFNLVEGKGDGEPSVEPSQPGAKPGDKPAPAAAAAPAGAEAPAGNGTAAAGGKPPAEDAPPAPAGDSADGRKADGKAEDDKKKGPGGHRAALEIAP